MPQDYDSGASDIDYLSDHHGKRVTPIAKPSDNNHLFRPPPGFRPNRQFNIAHGISERSQPKESREYLDTYAHVKHLGAGMILDELGEISLLDNGGLVQEDSRRIISADWPPARK